MSYVEPAYHPLTLHKGTDFFPELHVEYSDDDGVSWSDLDISGATVAAYILDEEGGTIQATAAGSTGLSGDGTDGKYYVDFTDTQIDALTITSGWWEIFITLSDGRKEKHAYGPVVVKSKGSA